MISDHNFICFGEDLGDTPFSKFHLMKRLSSTNRVLYVESIGLRSPSLSSRDVRRVVAKLRRWRQGCRSIGRNFYALSPVVIPLHSFAPVRNLDAILLRLQLAFWKRRLNMKDVILWIGVPTAAPLAGKLGERLLVYHCADKFTAYVEPEQKEFVESLHGDLLAKADVTLTPSESFYRELCARTASCHYLPHGVDYSHFSRAQDADLDIPEEIERLGKPIVGFFGTIDNHWIDFNLLAEAAADRPEWSFVLIGPVYPSPDVQRCMDIGNIHFLGPRPYADLPQYAKAFSVCILPKVRSSLTEASSPLKLREYLATGKPVISTLVPEKPFRSLVRFADTPVSFIAAVEDAIANDSSDARTARMASVAADSWECRVQTLSRILDQALGSNQPSNAHGRK